MYWKVINIISYFSISKQNKLKLSIKSNNIQYSLVVDVLNKKSHPINSRLLILRSGFIQMLISSMIIINISS